MSAGSPPSAAPPDCVRDLAAGRPFRVVWRNELGGVTFEVTTADGHQFIKWTPTHSGIDLQDEVTRLRWASRWSPVPRVLGVGTDEHGAWLMTAGLAGENAVSDRWIAEPQDAVTAIGQGLRALHDSLPVDQCPFSWSADTRIADARLRADLGRIVPGNWHHEHQHLDIAAALRLAEDRPDTDRLVVCHGDACAPNTLIGDGGRWSGHVDLGELGIADRWADIAVATWSTNWNYGPGWENTLLAAYGVEPDPLRTAYYRLLWDLGP